FFFSSRRRHTRSKRDWSSDVCSSDLLKVLAGILDPDQGTLIKPGDYQVGYLSQEPDLDNKATVLETVFAGNTPIMNAVRKYEQRSEERRVGKESRSGSAGEKCREKVK